MDPSIYEAFREARAHTALPRSKVLPASENLLPSFTSSPSRKSTVSDESTVRHHRSLESVSMNLGASPAPCPPERTGSDKRSIKPRHSLGSMRQSVRPRPRTVSTPSFAASKSPTLSESLPPFRESSPSLLNVDPTRCSLRQSLPSRRRTISRTAKQKLPIPRQSLPALPPRPRLDSSIFPFYDPNFPLCSPPPLSDIPSLPIRSQPLRIPVHEASESLVDPEIFIPSSLEPLPSREGETSLAESESQAPSPTSSSSYPQTPRSPGSPVFATVNALKPTIDEDFWYRPLPPPPSRVFVE